MNCRNFPPLIINLINLLIGYEILIKVDSVRVRENLESNNEIGSTYFSFSDIINWKKNFNLKLKNNQQISNKSSQIAKEITSTEITKYFFRNMKIILKNNETWDQPSQVGKITRYNHKITIYSPN